MNLCHLLHDSIREILPSRGQKVRSSEEGHGILDFFAVSLVIPASNEALISYHNRSSTSLAAFIVGPTSLYFFLFSRRGGLA